MSTDPDGSAASRSTQDPFRDGGPGLRAALAVRFLLELALLAGSAIAAVRLAPGWPGWLVAVAGVLLVGVVWGLLLSPKARIDIRPIGRVCLEAVLFGSVAGALWASELGGAGVTLLVAWILDRIALRLLSGVAAPRRSPRRRR
ncbi:YrdB family protein [Microbacterium sp. 22242]|uniref:YrdB family protein n=1 Tax=Microbacterium sp. 22242 TaxID=3453896 RepID=UPI003F84C1D4